jgi:rRNA-processing protein EBP2
MGMMPEDAKRERIYKADGMHEALEEFGWTDGAPWIETLIVTSAEPTEIPDVHDDLNRELAFYNQV